MISDADLLPGLRAASFRGVPFWIVDVSHQAGRRIIATWFPGTDIKAHDDTGRFDGPFSVSGLVVGDNYVAQAEALRRAFQTPGPGMFVHPWLGPRRCIVLKPAEISFASDELRVARIEVDLDPAQEITASLALGLAGAALSALFPILRGLAGGALARAISTFGWSAGLSAATAIVDRLELAAARLPDAAPVIARTREALVMAQALPVRADAAMATAVALIEGADQIQQLWRAAPPPALSPLVPPLPPPDQRAGIRSLTAAAAQLAATPRVIEVETQVLAAGEAAIAAGAAANVEALTFESRQDAMAWREVADRALAGAEQRLRLAAPTAPGLVAPAITAVVEARAALSATINEVVGRLPSVASIEIGDDVPALIIAQDLVGDDPRLVEPMVRDIVRRNRIRHPGAVRGRIEVLVP